MTRLLPIAGFELRQHLRSHVFWIVTAISAIMVTSAVLVPQLRVGLARVGLSNGAETVVRVHLVWSLFFVFASTAFVADAVLRDATSGFAPIMRAASITRFDYLAGRFTGAFAAVLLCFLSVPVALALASAAPWLDPAPVGPLRGTAYVFALVVIAVPNLVLSAALGFALATAMRSMTPALIGAMVLLIGYGLGSQPGALPAWAEPFGFSAYAHAVAGWPPVLRDTTVPPVTGGLLVNRLLVLAASAAALALAFLRPEIVSGTSCPVDTDQRRSIGVSPMVHRTPVQYGPIHVLAGQFAMRTRWEIGQIVWTPTFAVLLLLGHANAAAALWNASVPGAAATDTSAMIVVLADTFRLLPIVVALFYAGELIWNEHTHRIQAIMAATPAPNALFFLPKLLALGLVMIALAFSAALVAVAIEVVRAHPRIDLATYASWTALKSYEWLLIAALAMTLQAVSPSKVAGWGWMVLYLIVSLAMQRVGLTDPLYRYARYPGWPLPPEVSGAAHVGLYLAYWGVAATVLTLLAGGVLQNGSRPSAWR